MPIRTDHFPRVDELPPDAPTALSNPPFPLSVYEAQDAPTALSQEHLETGSFTPAQDVGSLPTGPLREEEERRRRILMGLPLLGGLAAEGQAPAAGVPMVQGTPQASGVPMVYGTPPGVGSPPPAHVAFSGAQPPAASPQVASYGGPSPIASPASLHRESPPHPRPPRIDSGPLRARHLHKAAHSKIALTSAIGGAVAVIVILAAGLGVIFTGSPTLSLTGSTVVSGGVLHLHGSHFIPGGSVTLTLDDGLPITSTGGSATAEARHAAEATASSLLAAGQLVQALAPRAISIGALGAFDVTLPVSSSWSLGSHTIHATENLGSRSATVQFKIDPTTVTTPGSFTIPGDANCSYNASQGWSCTASLSNSKYSPGNLNWSASSSGISGISFTPASGTLSPGQTQQVAISIPNTVCPASATFTFTFGGSVNPVSMPWSCIEPRLTASGGGNCPSNGSGNFICLYTLALAPGSQGRLNWSTSSDMAGVTFNPPGGTLSPGQSIRVTIAIPTTPCPRSGNLFFMSKGGTKNTVPFTCRIVGP